MKYDILQNDVSLECIVQGKRNSGACHLNGVHRFRAGGTLLVHVRPGVTVVAPHTGTETIPPPLPDTY